jgi:hypothetical protein
MAQTLTDNKAKVIELSERQHRSGRLIIYQQAGLHLSLRQTGNETPPCPCADPAWLSFCHWTRQDNHVAAGRRLVF